LLELLPNIEGKEMMRMRISGKFAERKLTPRIGFEIAARIKEHRNVRRLKRSVLETFPQEGIERESAPVRGIPKEGAVEQCSRTLMVVPTSTRNIGWKRNLAGRLGHQGCSSGSSQVFHPATWGLPPVCFIPEFPL
jgi:hypothetical protein